MRGRRGGQILLTTWSRQIAGARDGISFRSLGGLELKGISEPCRRSSCLGAGSGDRHRAARAAA